MLRGSEVKSLRDGHAQIGDAFARFEGDEAWLVSMHIGVYSHAQEHSGHEPERRRKLLLHRSELDRLRHIVDEQHLSLVPLSLYFKDGRAKVELALARGRKTYDKRQVLAERDAEREARARHRPRRPRRLADPNTPCPYAARNVAASGHERGQRAPTQTWRPCGTAPAASTGSPTPLATTGRSPPTARPCSPPPPSRPTDRVLDVGCGTGAMTRAAARLAGEGSALGVDIGRPLVEEARAETTAEGGPANVDVRAGRRPGPPVRPRRLRRGRQPVRGDVLRRPGGRVRQPPAGHGRRRSAGRSPAGRPFSPTTGCWCR